ncbi:MAG: SanA/YdcF family protein [Nevskiales bacterium]
MRYLIGLPLGLIGLAAALILLGNLWVVQSTKPYVYDELASLPLNDVGLLLGTSPYSRKGNESVLFQHRVEAAAALYKAGKIRHVLASGANPDDTYNEPRKMFYALVEAGVPPEAITLDFAGFRTLDSVIRATAVFKLDRFTVISQRFHVYRAVFIARHDGIPAIAYAPPEFSDQQKRRLRVREALARTGAILDMFLLRTQPRFLGEPVQINLDPAVEIPEKSEAPAQPARLPSTSR